MSKTLTANALAEIAKRFGTEPINIVEIDWETTTTSYADKLIYSIPGKIISLQGLDSVAKINGTGFAGNLSLTLDDTDGSIKNLLNTTDVHKRPIRVYQTFQALAEGDKFLLFSGEIVTPITWSEGDRTVELSAEISYDGKEVGFSPEEGEFDFIADSAVGVPWPLCFGSPLRVPAVKLTEAVRGTSLTRYGLITQDDLDTLCTRAAAVASLQFTKDFQDTDPSISEANYDTTLTDLGTAQASLNLFYEGLVADSPTQQSLLDQYVQLCKDIQLTTQERDSAIQTQAAYPVDREALEREYTTVAAELQAAIAVFRAEGAGTNDVNKLLVEQKTIELDWIENGVPDLQYEYILNKQEYQALKEAEQNKIDTFQDDANPTLRDTYAAEETRYENLIDLDKYKTQVPDNNHLLGLSGLGALQTVNSTSFVNVPLLNEQLDAYELQKANLEAQLTEVVLDTIIVDGGDDFPQGTEVDIIINGAKFRGTFSGETFTVSDNGRPVYTNIAIAPRQNDNENEFWIADATVSLKGQYCFINESLILVNDQVGTRCFFEPVLYRQTGTNSEGAIARPIYDFRYIGQSNLDVINETSVIRFNRWVNYLNALGKPGFVNGLGNLPIQDYSIEIGDDVYLDGYYNDVYVANLIPSTQVYEVLAKRTIDGEEKLVPVPSRYFTVNLSESIAGQNATTIRFQRPLTQYQGEQWGDDIWVSLTSSEGPNTADVIDYLLTTYSDVNTDAATFASVNTSLTNYPSHFAILDKPNVFTVCEQIAWQARCGIYLKDDTVYIKYLSAEESEVQTLTTSNVDFGTFVLEHTPTEDLVTKFVAKWRRDYEHEDEHEIVLRNNVRKYGLFEEEFDFFIYNIPELVTKSATFWLIRLSNIWKTLSCQVPLDSLELETFDTVAMDFPDDLIASASVKGVVLDASYDSDSQAIQLNIQTAVPSGRLAEHELFWPATSSATYPTAFDEYAGGGN